MSKYQEAYKRIMWLLEKLADWNGYDLSDLDDEYNYMEDEKALQELVDKAIPKEPLGQTFKRLSNGEYIEKFFCPTCKSELEENEHHCPCGQEIDWSDEE